MKTISPEGYKRLLKYAAWADPSSCGPYAVLAWCNVLTITRHQTIEDAMRSKEIIDASACGSRCQYTSGHEVVRLRK